MKCCILSEVCWRRESAQKGLNTTSGPQFASLPLVKPVVWFVRAVVNWRSRSVAKSVFSLSRGASPFLAWGDFTRARVSLALLSLRKNRRLLVVYISLAPRGFAARSRVIARPLFSPKWESLLAGYRIHAYQPRLVSQKNHSESALILKLYFATSSRLELDSRHGLITGLIAELLARAKRARSGAPWVRKFGKLSVWENLVMT